MMVGIAAAGNGMISFDIMVDGSSFPAGVANWYSLNMAGNSDGALGWTQTDRLSGDAWHNADDPALISTHVEKTFAEMGWEPGDSWFQIFLGANSADDFPVGFYIDNLTIVPEPSVFALAGLGAVLLLLVRRHR
jgi:hypothetical protein